jgi:hypothetical protein
LVKNFLLKFFNFGVSFGSKNQKKKKSFIVYLFFFQKSPGSKLPLAQRAQETKGIISVLYKGVNILVFLI